MQLGTGVRVAGTQKMFNVGGLQTTEAPLDMAIDGRGFFQISMPDGSIAYTRDGQFQLDQDGQIVNSQGHPLDPAISIPQDAASVTIGSDGTVTVMTRGSAAATQVGSIELANFVNPAGLQAAGSNLFYETPASGSAQTGTPGSNGLGEIMQGALENSNVSVVEELVNMVSVQRAYEMNSRVVSTSDQMLQYLTQNV
jgi:flagellar basal-body rod protein FlgG